MPFLTTNNTADLLGIDSRISSANATLSGLAAGIVLDTTDLENAIALEMNTLDAQLLTANATLSGVQTSSSSTATNTGTTATNTTSIASSTSTTATNTTNINNKTPSLGQAAMTGSSPVTIATDDILKQRSPGNGFTEADCTGAGVVTIGTVTSGVVYGLRIIPSTDGNTAIGHYRPDGTDPDQNDCPITANDCEHVIIPRATASLKIIRDTRITNGFYAYAYPL